MQRRIGITEFRTRRLAVLREVEQRGIEVLITRRGKPVARLIPVRRKVPRLFGRMRGTIEIRGDIVSGTGERWEADR